MDELNYWAEIGSYIDVVITVLTSPFTFLLMPQVDSDGSQDTFNEVSYVS